MAKYRVNYTSAATGYGWCKEYERLEDFEETINAMRADAMAYITVWDNELKNSFSARAMVLRQK